MVDSVYYLNISLKSDVKMGKSERKSKEPALDTTKERLYAAQQTSAVVFELRLS